MFSNRNKFNFNKINVLNLLISAIPLSLIIGNLATNINIILICVVGFLIFGKEVFFTNRQENYLLYLFFFYLIIITAFNNLPLLNKNDLYLDHLLKSLFFIRFFILFLIITKLVEKREFNTNIFFTSCAFFSIIIAIDITIQFFFKSNILGYPIINNKPSSFFKSENVAGGYIQKFILFFIFLLSIKKKEINYIYSIIFFSIIFFSTIILTGNRMPVILFIISIILFLFFEKKLKQIIITFVILSLIIFSFTKITISERLHVDLKSFISESIIIMERAPKLFLYNEMDEEYSWKSGYLIHFNSGVQQWKDNKIFGAGLKSFRMNCSYKEYQTCNTHPHNYFIELLVDTGLLGTVLIYLVFIIGFKNFLNFYFNEKNINSKLTSIIFFLLIFTELLPIRSSGSFFTTNNATFIFLILPLFLNIKKIKKLK